MWKQMLRALGFLKVEPVGAPDDSEGALEPDTDASVETPDADDAPASSPTTREVSAVWPLDAILDRVIREPKAASYLAPADLARLPVLADASMDPVRPSRTLAIAYVWATHTPIPEAYDDFLAAAVWSGRKWQLMHELDRVRELLQMVGRERAERILLRNPEEHEGLLRFFEAVPTATVALTVARNGNFNAWVLRLCAPHFTPGIWDVVTRDLMSRKVTLECARVLLGFVTDPVAPEWQPLWAVAMSAADLQMQAPFWRAFEGLELERRVELALAADPVDPRAAARAVHPDVARRLVRMAADVASIDDPVRVALESQGDLVIEPILAVLPEAPEGRGTLLDLLARTLDPRRVEALFRFGALDSRKASREVARRALSGVPFAELEPLYREAFADHRKTVRKAALDLLEARPGEAIALARELAAVETADDLRARFESLAGASDTVSAGAGESPFADFESAVLAVTDLVAGSALIADPEALKARLDSDPDGTLALLAALAPHARAPWALPRSEVASDKLVWAWSQVSVDAPLARYALARSIATARDWMSTRFLMYAPHDAEFGTLLLAACEQHGPDSWRMVLQWFEDHAPDRLPDICRIALRRPGSWRSEVDPFLLSLGGAAVPLIAPQLEASKAEDRKHAVQLLAALPDPAALAALEARLPSERSKVVKEALIVAVRKQLGGPDGLVAQHPVDADLDEALVAQPRPAVPGWVDRSVLPTLLWKDGTPVSDGATDWFLGTFASSREMDAGLLSITGRLDGDRAAELYDVLRTLHDPETQRSDARWMIYASGFVGSSAHRDALARKCDEQFRGGQHQRAQALLDVLVAVGDPASIRWLEHWSRKARSSGLTDNATERLNALADARGVPVSVLVETAIPDLGFDASGERTLTSGDRTFTLTVADGDVEIAHEGKAFKSLPGARKGEDAAAVKAAKAELAALRADVKVFQGLAAGAFEQAMVSGRSWSPSRWRALVEHPVVRPVAERVVFETVAGERFCLADGLPTGADGQPVTVEGDIRVAHPVEGELFAFEDRVGSQPFEQIDRPTFTGDALPGLVASRTRMDSRTLQSVLGRRGYRRGEVMDGGWVVTMERILGDQLVVVNHSGFPVGYAEEVVTVENVEVLGRNRRGLDLSALGTRLVSEIAMDVASLP